jgi:small-conductance mechanosensitive channel
MASAEKAGLQTKSVILREFAKKLEEKNKEKLEKQEKIINLEKEIKTEEKKLAELQIEEPEDDKKISETEKRIEDLKSELKILNLNVDAITQALSNLGQGLEKQTSSALQLLETYSTRRVDLEEKYKEESKELIKSIHQIECLKEKDIGLKSNDEILKFMLNLLNKIQGVFQKNYRFWFEVHNHTRSISFSIVQMKTYLSAGMGPVLNPILKKNIESSAFKLLAMADKLVKAGHSFQRVIDRADSIADSGREELSIEDVKRLAGRVKSIL